MLKIQCDLCGSTIQGRKGEDFLGGVPMDHITPEIDLGHVVIRYSAIHRNEALELANASLRADAAIGALVRQMPDQVSLKCSSVPEAPCGEHAGEIVWTVSFSGGSVCGDTAEDALRNFLKWRDRT